MGTTMSLSGFINITEDQTDFSVLHFVKEEVQPQLRTYLSLNNYNYQLVLVPRDLTYCSLFWKRG